MHHGSPASGDWLRFGGFQASPRRNELLHNGRPVEVGQRGMALLLALLRQAGTPVSKASLMEAGWGRRTVEPSNLTVQIASLRRQLEREQGAGAFIRTVPGLGYVFAGPVDSDQSRHRTEARTEAGPGADLRKPAGIAEPLTRFIGRDEERQELIRHLRARRLVTLTGIGGVGKTRLTLRLRQDLADAFPDGTPIIDLARVVDPAQVTDAVAAALGAGGGREVDAALAAALRGRSLLLILDNAEHLTAAVGRVLAFILDVAPGVSALVTSRESLGLPGEVVVRLSPLPLPAPSPQLTAREALGSDAVRLLADRAAALLPGFRVDDGNAGALAEICRRLDGIPLAIEMAVPRLEVLTAGQLAARLHDRFGTVASLRHDVPPRQRTLRAMFDWSWELLAARERRVLQILAVFGAGATLEMLESQVAAEAADADAGPDAGAGPADILQQVTALAQSSLVVLQRPGRIAEGEVRYRLLETTRQYALEQLSPAEHVDLSRRHALGLAQLFERAEAEWPCTHGATWLGRYGPDADNLRAAMRWASGTPGEGVLAARLVAASFSLWWELPGLPLREGRQWYAAALAAGTPCLPPPIRARLLLGQSWTDTVDGDVENYPAAALAAQLFQEAGDRVGQGTALWRAAGTVMFRDGEPSATVLVRQALQVLDPHLAPKWRALCHIRQGDLLQAAGDGPAALDAYDQAIATARAWGHPYGMMVAGGNRAFLMFTMGQSQQAVAALRALHAELPLGLRHPVASLLAMALTASGQDADAWDMVLEGISGTISLGMVATLARSIEALALLASNAGDAVAAARLLGFALQQHAAGRQRLGPREVVYQRLRRALAQALTEAERDRLTAKGAAWTEAEAAAAALRVHERAAASKEGAPAS